MNKTASTPTIALLGGSFDPPTTAHLTMAQALLTLPQRPVDQVWFLPSCNHPFGKNLTPFAQRMEMLQTLTSEKIGVCDLEALNPQLKGTTAVVQELLKRHPGREFLFAMGSDCLFDFDQKWISPHLLAKLLPFLIFPRVGHPTHSYRGLLSRPPHQILSSPAIPNISSSAIRQQLRQDSQLSAVAPYLPDPVRRYLQKNPLYTLR